ncbi:hypothetical protein JOL62DRAFT_616679 [Phyllosticta paracitricarpa]|uniref:Uncharacterized protein n=1 Tax=Phyllosticta paracitricarpa TaxID=2016321 RepID=A0ABR1MSH7_9PEZI
MFNLSDRQLLVVATLIDDVYVTAKFQCLRNDQKSRYLDVLADAEDLDIDDMTVDPLPPPRDPDDAMDMHDPDYFRVYFLSEKLGQPFHVIAHSFRKLRRIGQHWILGVDRDQDFEGFEDFEEWRKKAEQDWARSHRRQSHLARLMNDPRLKHRSKPEWERNYERPKNPKDEK